MSRPDRSRQDTFRLGSLTKAIIATHRPIASAAQRNSINTSALAVNYIEIKLRIFHNFGNLQRSM